MRHALSLARADEGTGPKRAVSLVRLTTGLLALAMLVSSEVAAVYRQRAHSVPYETDFHATIWQPARDVLNGIAPYANPHVPGFVPETVYPPLAFLPALPLASLNLETATALFQVVLVVAGVCILLALGVRDWRCHLLWLLTPLMLIPIVSVDVTPVIVLCAALVWRWRDRALLAAGALSVAIAVKLLLAPLFLWLVLTRRYRAAAYTAIGAPILLLGPWAAVGFNGLLDYPATLRIDSRLWGADGAFVQALVRQTGLSSSVALAAGLAVAAVLVGVAWRSSELLAFALVSAAALALSPIGWVYYAGILIVPLAVRYPRFARPWLVLNAFWISWYYSPIAYKTIYLSVATIAAAAWLVVVAFRRRAAAEYVAERGIVELRAGLSLPGDAA
jgi:hypothetical protein